jgi:hypothetical protein
MTTLQDVQGIPAVSKKRPLWVWILTIWDGLALGFVPLLFSMLLLFNENSKNSSGLSLQQIFPSILLSLAVIIAAFFAWRGNNLARFALLVCVLIYYGGLIYNNFKGYELGIMTQEQVTLASGRIIRSLFWIVVNFGFFLNKKANHFYTSSKEQPN